MKIRKKLLAIIISVVVIFSAVVAVGCGDSVCQHEYEYTVISQATCERKGEIEGICKKCGNKIYNDVVELGHSYVNETCVRCGKTKDSVYVPEGSEFGLTLTDIFETAKNKIDVESEIEFLRTLSYTKLNNVYVKSSKVFLALEGKGYSFDFWWGIDKVELQVSCDISQNLLTIKVQDDGYGYKLQALYVDGTQKDIGYFTHNNEHIKLIERLAVNTSNEFLVVFDDNKVVNMGELLDAPIDIDESVLVYEKYGDGYSVVGTMDKNIEEVVIPKTHRGKQISIIDDYAFAGCSNLQKITISNSVESIGECAFYNCSNLQNITIPDSVENIKFATFSGCKNLKTITMSNSIKSIENYVFNICKALTSINFSGTKEEWNAIKKGFDWDYGAENFVIYCSNGNIQK